MHQEKKNVDAPTALNRERRFIYFYYRNNLFILAVQIYINAIQQKS